MRLENKTAVITGGNRGIGRGISLTLAKEGANVVVAARDFDTSVELVEEIRKNGGNAIAVQLDVTNYKNIQDMYKKAEAEYGKIDISVQNAGIISTYLVESMPEKEFDRIIEINLKGTFLCCKAVIPYMKKNNFGRIINVSSIAGKMGFSTLSHYAASKFAIIGFTNSLAKEVATENITANVICPGIVKTHMWDRLAEDWKKPGESPEDSWNRSIKEIIPQQKPQTPEDMGELAVYFATAENVTGQAFNVDGGIMLG